mgnify:CR=1 FL=1
MTGLLYSIPLITIGAASAFGWMLAYLRGPAVVSEWIASAAGGDPFMIMLLLTLLFIIVGDFIDAVPAIIIFMPLIIDLTKNADINPVYMGVVIITTLAFGLITPPYGLCLLMASKFVGIKFSKAMLASLPIYIVFFAAIAFTIFFPDVVLWLPKKLLPHRRLAASRTPTVPVISAHRSCTCRPSKAISSPVLKAPAGICDTPMHVYDGRYPTAPTAKFVPPDAPVSAISENVQAARHPADGDRAAINLRQG